MTGHTILEIAGALRGEAVGETGIRVSGAAEPALAGAAQLAVAMEPRYVDSLAKGKAVAALLSRGMDWQALGLKAAVLVDRPRLAMAGLTELLDSGHALAAGIHPTAIVDPSARLGRDVALGPYVVIGPGVVIGARSRIDSHVSVAAGTEIGEDALILAGVRLGRNARIGHRFVAHSGVVIGADGFSFVTPEKSSVEAVRETLGAAGDGEAGQAWLKIHSLGGVVIGDDVEIGANSSVDAGTIRATSVGDGTKIDALVQVGHNVQVGKNCLLCAHVAVGGSARIGDNVVLGGQVGVADNISLGDGVVAGGATKILSNVPAGRAILGYPAMKMETHIEVYKALRRLPRLFAIVDNLQKSFSKTGQDD
ncbi:MAG: UDP-3-O-(3-hydroxymyristoyl)glucosamine N-acyltransferase [Paracoccaceae bacterium]